MKYKKIVIFLFIFTIMLFSYNTNNTNANCEYETSAKGMVVIESSSKRILCENNCHQRLPMASTTKIATALTVLNNCDDLDKIIVVDNSAIGIEGTSIYLKRGEKLSIRELLYGMMLPSGNDASIALACAISGTEEKFVKEMNSIAKKLGAKNTHFSNCHGLDQENHYTTAYDLALITAKAMENDFFKELASAKNVKITGSTQDSCRYLKNKNKLLWDMKECTGVKIGYTDNARRCLVASSSFEDLNLICVVLNCGNMFEEAKKLMLDASETYNNYQLLEPHKYIRKVSVEDGKSSDVKVFSRKSFKYPLKEDELDKIRYEYDIPNTLKSPIRKEEIIGKVKIYLDNHLLFCENIYTMEEVKSINIFAIAKDIISQWT